MEIDQQRSGARRRQAEQPLQQQEQRAGEARDLYDTDRPNANEKARHRNDQDDRKHGRSEHDLRKPNDRKRAQKEGVPQGLARDLLGDHAPGDERRGEERYLLGASPRGRRFNQSARLGQAPRPQLRTVLEVGQLGRRLA